MALEELKQLAEQGDVNALIELGNNYHSGTNGVEQHLTNAVKCWKKVIEIGNSEQVVTACQHLIAYYMQSDMNEALNYAQIESSHGSDNGLIYVATTLCENEDFTVYKGLNILMQLALKGNPDAQRIFPSCAQEFIEKGGDLTPELSNFLKTHYSAPLEQSRNDNSQPLTRWGKIKKYISLAVVAVLIIWGLWVWITPTVVVIENGNKYRTENCFGSLKVLNPNGKEIELNGLKLFTRYVYNGTQSNLVCYNVIYTDDKSSNDIKETSFLIKPNVLKEMNVLPDYYFEEAPETIEVEQDLLDAILGQTEEKWVIDEYISVDEIPSLPTEKVIALAESGNDIAQYYASLRYLEGDAVPADTLKAFEWMQKCASQRCAMGELGLGLMFSSGLGTPENPQQAFEYIKRASSHDNAEAHWYLATLYYNGYGVKQDMTLYKHYIELSAIGGFVNGQTEYALHLLEERRTGVACEWLDKALKQNPNPTHIAIAGFSLIDIGGENNITKGYKYLQYAAQKGEADAVAALKKYPTLDLLNIYLRQN